jgi:acyl-CoA thioester hydrolase
MARADFTAVHRLRVRWAESDMQGIVFNGHYLTYFDVAVTEYWRAIGLPYPETTADTGGEMYTVKATIEYHRPARYDDELDVLMRCARIGRSSLTFLVEIWRQITCQRRAHLCTPIRRPATGAAARAPAAGDPRPERTAPQ